jgi:hypothetical protein
MAPVMGCAVDKVNLPPSLLKEVQYRYDGPPAFTLFTMVNNKTNAGAHSSLRMNASRWVIFDPAGTFKHDILI